MLFIYTYIIYTVAYPEGFTHLYINLGTQTMHPNKRKTCVKTTAI